MDCRVSTYQSTVDCRVSTYQSTVSSFGPPVHSVWSLVARARRAAVRSTQWQLAPFPDAIKRARSMAALPSRRGEGGEAAVDGGEGSCLPRPRRRARPFGPDVMRSNGCRCEQAAPRTFYRKSVARMSSDKSNPSSRSFNRPFCGTRTTGVIELNEAFATWLNTAASSQSTSPDNLSVLCRGFAVTQTAQASDAHLQGSADEASVIT